ncbi:hypothetical protein BH23ACT2_BH23ACT2_31130 [soil metagenome]
MTLRRSTQLLVAVLATVVALALASPAGAIDNPDYTAPAPAEVTENATPAAQGDAVSAQGRSAGEATDREWLPITGSDVIALLGIGAVLVAGGAGVLMVRRRANA